MKMASQLDKAEEIVGVVLPSERGSGAAIESKRPTLRGWLASVAPMRRDHLAVPSQLRI